MTPNPTQRFSPRHARACSGQTGTFVPRSPAPFHADPLSRISRQLTVEARDRPAITSLRLLTVLNVLFKYASAR